MEIKRAVLLLAMLVCAAVAESIRETETMNANEMIDAMESSGSLPDDEDIDDPDYYDDLDSDSDSESDDEGSGSGDLGFDLDDDIELTMDTPTTTMGNMIPQDKGRKRNDDNNGVIQDENEIIPKADERNLDAEPSNEVSMASTAHSFFNKTEVIVALVAGTLVGLLFAVFIIVLLIMRIRRNKGDLTYDPVKKPIYKKAPTVEA